MSKRIAVVLAGSGRSDGSEIHESVSVLVHLSRKGWGYRCFAPDAPQAEVVNHATDQVEPGATRNMLAESARISRGDITPLNRLDASAFDALVLPGGFGAAKNLCDFASKGAACTVRGDVAQAIKAFHGAGKPIGLCCIAPIIAARVLGTASGGPGCTITLGAESGAAAAARAMGATHEQRGVTQACVDRANRLVTTPAYMHDATPHQVFEGIGVMVEEMGSLMGV